MKTKLLMLATALTVSACAGLTQVTVPQSNINIVDREIETDQKMTYTLTKTYVLGIGGLSKKARNTNIIDELFKKANLKNNETLAYITQAKNTNTFLGIVTIVKHSASGYVVRPIAEQDNAAIPYYSNKNNSSYNEGQNRDTLEPVKKMTKEETIAYVNNKLAKSSSKTELKELQIEVDQFIKNKVLSYNEATRIYKQIRNKIKSLK